MNKTFTYTIGNDKAAALEAREAKEAKIIKTITTLAHARGISVHKMARLIVRSHNFMGMQDTFGPEEARLIRTVAKRIYSEVA